MTQSIPRSIAFIGIRPEQMPALNDAESEQCTALIVFLINEIDRFFQDGYTTFYCSAAPGIGILCGELLAIKKEISSPDLRLICTIPYRNHALHFSSIWKLRNRCLLRDADRVVLTGSRKEPDSIFQQYKYMIDQSDLTVIVEGTESKDDHLSRAFDYAQISGKDVLLINPFTLRKVLFFGTCH